MHCNKGAQYGLSVSHKGTAAPACFLYLTRSTIMCTGDGGPAAEVPLDGTVYDLETGKVLVWCPKNNPLRFVLGSLKVCQPTLEDACQSH